VQRAIIILAERAIALAGSSSDLAWNPLPEDDPNQRCPDIALATEILKWSPKVVLDEGLSYTIDYFRQLLPQLKKS
ncbi:MAG: SDR family NAD-dependent epimerase/dehydratase, partial [Cyanobacteria bacterium HKST-UBA01]|nr:SDR family NAD-dependent epimerase/dehydratase [Cyanobacteria bacterium HKST-UBA01]